MYCSFLPCKCLSKQKERALLGELQQLSLGGMGGYDGPSSAPISIRGYQGGPHIGSSLLGGSDLPGSPSNSIWTPSPGVDKLRPMGSPSPVTSLGTSAPRGLPSIKTVAELEQEMKLQSARGQPSLPLQVSCKACVKDIHYLQVMETYTQCYTQQYYKIFSGREVT